METQYDRFKHLTFERPTDGVLLVTISRPAVLNAMNEQLHEELGSVWKQIAEDVDTRVVVITGAGKAFSAGGDLDMVERQVGSPLWANRILREASAIVYNMINTPQPIISAINGVAVGAGLAVALMADISVIGEDVRLTDGHARLGVAAGDHAAIIWPLLCGMAKAKYYLLTSDFIDGREAERIGLVSKCVPVPDVLPAAMEIASRLAAGPQEATRFTKYALNNWLRSAGPIFDTSIALEMLNFFGLDIAEGLGALRERRTPKFPSAASPCESDPDLGGRGPRD